MHRFAPLDGSDACTTGIFNPFLGEWHDDILAFVAGEGDPAGGEKLAALLGKPSTDGGKAVSFPNVSTWGATPYDFASDKKSDLIDTLLAQLGTISPYFVKRFGFSPSEFVSFLLHPSPTAS